MKKIVSLLIIMMILVINCTTFAEETLNTDVLSLESVLNEVESTSTIKDLDHQIISLYNTYVTTNDTASSIPIDLMNQARASLSQTVFGPPITGFVMGQPVTYDHTLSEGEITQILANFGFPYTKKDKLAQDTLVYLLPKNLLSSHKVLQKSRDLAVNSMKLGLEELYNGLLIQDELTKLNKEIADVSDMRLKNMLQKYRNGLVSKKEYESFKLEVEQNQLRLKIQERSKQNTIYTLNKLLGRNISQEYEYIEGQIVKIEDPKIDLEAAISKALENRFEIFQLKEDIVNTERELMFTNIHYRNTEQQYLTVKYKLDTAKRNLEDTKQNIRFELEDAYQRILLNENSIKKAQIQLDEASKNYESMKKRYDNGLVTKEVLDLSHISVSSAKVNLLSSINTYNMSIKKFEAATGLGPAFTEGV